MNWGQFEDPIFRMCLAVSVLAPWSPIQEVVGLNPCTEVTNLFCHLIYRIH